MAEIVSENIKGYSFTLDNILYDKNNYNIVK